MTYSNGWLRFPLDDDLKHKPTLHFTALLRMKRSPSIEAHANYQSLSKQKGAHKM